MDEHLLDFVERGARSIARDFEDPDDDWQPVLFVVKEDGDRAVAMVPMDDKDATAAIITGALRMFGAVEAVLLASAWRAEFPKDSNPEESYLPPSMLEGRQEILMLTYVGAGGNETRTIPINRIPGYPPTLGKADSFSTPGGRFVEAMQRGIE